MRSLILLSCLILSFVAHSQPPALGGWREHLPYSSVKDIAFFDNQVIVAATPYSLFTYRPSENYIERKSRVSGLSETGIQLIHSPGPGLLLVVYSNNNIDIISSSSTRNIRDIVNSNQVPEGGINDVFSDGDFSFLSTEIGIIVLDRERNEVKETWRIGNNGQDIICTGLTRYQNQYYAATAEGLKTAPTSATNLADYANWSLASGTNGLPAGSCDRIFQFNNHLLAGIDNRMFRWENTSWQPFYETDFEITSITVSENKLSICEQKPGGKRIQVLDVNGATIQTLNAGGLLQSPQKAIWLQNDCWIADSINGLLRYQNNSITSILPASPLAIAGGKIIASPAGILATRGAVNNNTGSNLPGSWFQLDKDGWKNFGPGNFPALDTISDLHSITFNPANSEIWTGSWSDGLLQWKDGQLVKTYKQGYLSPDPQNLYKTGGLATDVAGNIWIGNPSTSQPLVVRTASNSWYRFSSPYGSFAQNPGDIAIDKNSYKWISAQSGGLVCYWEGNDLQNTADDRWQRYLFGSGAGNLPGTEVTSVVADRQGFIWAGTDNGMAVIECPERVFTSSPCEAYLPVIQSGNFAGYLFAGERILSIAVDGADRKWVGTEKGAWLVSATGDAILEYWHTGNSPLPNNRVHSIAIDATTGEVFFATSMGMVSWRGKATEPAEEKPQVQVFPNPVPPGFNGNIGIRGLRENSIVKITELNGRLVYQTRSSGGQATWNGRDYNGRKISTGVYLVLVSDENKKEQAVGKIVFVNK